MKDERNVRRSRAAGRRWQPVAILLAAVLMVLSVPLGLKSAHADETEPYEPIDLLKECGLTVNPVDPIVSEYADDIATANVVIDLYRVADAKEMGGYDTYDWEINEPFSSIGEIDGKIDNEGWKKLAQKAADIVLGTAPEGQTEWDPTANTEKIDSSLKSTDNPAGTEITGLKAGLYLVIAHGKDVKKYATTVTDEAAGTSGTATIANSKAYSYKFAPELVSLPTKTPYPDEETGTINTANPGNWIYSPTIKLKPSQEVRLGNLEIVKTLDDYADREKKTGDNPRLMKDPATFVFKMTVYEDESKANVIKEDYFSAVFDEYGTKTIMVEGLPVDSFVVVKEEYSGRNYSAKVEEGSATIVANETAQVPFENYYDDREGGGGAVTNKFTNSEEAGKWKWEQVSDSSTDGTVIDSDSKSENSEGKE